LINLHILCISDGPTSGTGFGEQLRPLMFRLAQHGHEVTWLSLQQFGYPVYYYDYMFPDLPHKKAKIRMVGNWGDPKHFGADIFVKHYKDYTPDLVFIMGDPYIIPFYARLKQQLGFPLLHYVTLDGVPINPEWKKYMGVPNIRIWAREEYAKEEIATSTIPHAINTKWWSVTKENKNKTKQIYGIPEDTTVVINWDTNQHRKRFDALLRCWKMIKPNYLNVKLILYTDWNCRLGWDIENLIKQYKVPRNTILSPKDLTGKDKHWENAEPPEKLREIAQMGDIYATTTSGEGYGVCMAEAQSLGIPVIAPKYSSIPEVVRTGYHVPLYHGRAGKFRWHDNCRSVEGAIVNEERFAETLNRLIENKDKREKMSKLAKNRIRIFDWSNIMPLWLKLFDSIDTDSIFAREILSL